VPSAKAAIAWLASSRAGRAARWLACGDAVVGAAMVALVVYYVATHGVFQGKASGDGWFGFQYLNALIHHRTLDMKSVLAQWLPYFGTDPITHHMPNRCPFGPVFVWLPFYLVADGLAAIARLFGAHVANDSPFHTWVTGLGSLACVLVGWRYVYALTERHAGRTAARVGSIAAVWATPMAWYAVTQPLYQHAPAFVFVAILIERWDATRGEHGWRRFALLGFVGGMAMEMRAQEVLWLLLPGCECAWRVLRGPRRRAFLIGGVVLCAAAFVAFVPQLLVWRYYTGAWHGPQVEPLRLDTPMPIVALFSTRSGLLPWSPIVYASVAGCVLARRAARPLVLALAAVFAIELYVVSSAWLPSGAYSYGARRLSDAAPLFGLGVALLYDRAAARRWARRAVVGFTAFSVALCFTTMELQRWGVPSSGSSPRTAAHYLRQVGAPVWMQRVFGAIGYPFVQPVGWLFAAYHRVPVSTFEGVVGTFLLDREGQYFSVMSKSLVLCEENSAFVIDGLALAPQESKRPAVVTGPVRFMLPMFAHERVGVQVLGEIPPVGEVRARWNGADVPVTRTPTMLTLQVPAANVRVGVNDLRLTLPAGAKLTQLEFLSYDTWWK
jgi:hypothetical protein